MPAEPLTAAEAALIDLSAAIASRDPASLRAAAERARNAADPLAVEEIVLQSHLFVGFPLALEALILWREVAGTEAPASLEESPDLWERRGEEVCARVYGPKYQRLRANVRALHPDLDRWMVEGGYGKVIGRPGLDLRLRELCIAALLAVWQTPRQLHSHLVGALNAGATASQVEAAVGIAERYLDAEGARAVREIWLEKIRTA